MMTADNPKSTVSIIVRSEMIQTNRDSPCSLPPLASPTLPLSWPAEATLELPSTQCGHLRLALPQGTFLHTTGSTGYGSSIRSPKAVNLTKPDRTSYRHTPSQQLLPRRSILQLLASRDGAIDVAAIRNQPLVTNHLPSNRKPRTSQPQNKTANAFRNKPTGYER